MGDKLRPDQDESQAKVRIAWHRGHRRVLFVLPTGGGKTVVATNLIGQAVAQGLRVLVLHHRRELVRQTSRTLSRNGLDHGFIISRHEQDLGHPVQIATVQTLAARMETMGPDAFDLIVADEAHHCRAPQFMDPLDFFQGARALGLTATPRRTDGQPLGPPFDAMVLGPSVQWLTDEGHLTRAVFYRPPTRVDLAAIRIRHGEQVSADLIRACAEADFWGDMIQEYRRNLGHGTAIAFCRSVEHAETVAAEFTGAGIAAASIDGRMNDDQRLDLLGRLEQKELKVLASCALIGEGLDIPSVDGCLLLRKMGSEIDYLQAVGRALRVSPGKDRAVVLDFFGNSLPKAHGHYLANRHWSLDGRKKRARSEVHAKDCRRCYATISLNAKVCPECGAKYQGPPQAGGEELTGVPVQLILSNEAKELAAAEVMLKRRRRALEESQCRTYEDFLRLGIARGYSKPQGWARHRARARNSRWGQRQPIANGR